MEYTVTVNKKDARTKSGVRPYQKVEFILRLFKYYLDVLSINSISLSVPA